MKVLQVLPALESGGVERGTVEVAEHLLQRGHEPLVISAGGRMVAELDALGVEHIRWPIGAKSPLTLRWVGRLRRLLRQRGIDVLHARSRVPAWVAYLAWRAMPADQRPRFITTMHGLHSVSRYSAIMTRGERVIAVSRTVEQHIRENYPRCDPQRIVVIPRGVAPAAFAPMQPDESWRRTFFQEHMIAPGRPIITLPGRLTRLKGHMDFLEVMHWLRQGDRPGAHAVGLIVGGEDPRRQAYAAELREAVEELGLQEHVVFTGFRSDMREIYAISDLVLSLSTSPESFGRAALEPLTMQRPVIGYDHGGVGEILREIYPAGAVPVGDIEALTERIRAFLDDDAPPVPDSHPYTRRRMLEAIVDLYENAT